VSNVNGVMEGVVADNTVCEKVSKKGDTYWGGEVLVDVDQGWDTRDGHTTKMVRVPFSYYTNKPEEADKIMAVLSMQKIRVTYMGTANSSVKDGVTKYWPKLEMRRYELLGANDPTPTQEPNKHAFDIPF